METEDVISVPASSGSGSGTEKKKDPHEFGHGPLEMDSLRANSELKHGFSEELIVDMHDGVNENKEGTVEVEKDRADGTPVVQVGFKLKTVAVAENVTTISAAQADAENGLVAVQDERCVSKDGTTVNHSEIAATSISGIKRPRIAIDEQQPSVHITYNCLTRDSKKKLQELLHQWSRWHALSCSSSDGSAEVLESGEETYFPALHVGVDKPSAVTFWVDSQIGNQPSKEFIPVDDGKSVPLYDRGYSAALTFADGSGNSDGGLEKLDTSRCFNCGSYSHALKDCPKPRDNVAVNNARKQHNVKRNQHANSRNSIRYYQNSRGGKYDGLKPGVLDAETRKLLGLGELDPPPWLNRMREIGYPPGYLDIDDEDNPSGIIIFADEAIKDETEEGEIADPCYAEPSIVTSGVQPSRKKSVKFPGINAPIPKDADERLWSAGSSTHSSSRDRPYRRYNHSSQNSSRESYHELYQKRSREHYHEPSENLRRGYQYEQRWSRGFEDDGPPGCEPGTSPSLSYHAHRYADYDSSSFSFPSPRFSSSLPRSPLYGRSFSDRDRRGPLVQDDQWNYSRFGSSPYSSSHR